MSVLILTIYQKKNVISPPDLSVVGDHLQNFIWPELKEGSSQVKWTHLSHLIWVTTPSTPLLAVPNRTHKNLMSRLVLPHQWASSLSQRTETSTVYCSFIYFTHSMNIEYGKPTTCQALWWVLGNKTVSSSVELRKQYLPFTTTWRGLCLVK